MTRAVTAAPTPSPMSPACRPLTELANFATMPLPDLTVVMNPDMFSLSLPIARTMSRSGPTAAVMPPIAEMNVWTSSGSSTNHSVASPRTSARRSMNGTRLSPTSDPSTCAMFCRRDRDPEKPSAFLLASLAASPASPHWSLTPFHASLDMRRLSSSPPMVCMRPSMACTCLVAVIPSSESVAVADPPSSSMPFSPSMKERMAVDGSLSHAEANSCALMPDTSAKAIRESPPDATADSMSAMVLLIAVPAASAFWPVDAIEDAQARTSGVDMPMMDAMEPMRFAMSMICDSVDAPLLPRRTSASENCGIVAPLRSFMMLSSWPSAVAAVSASRSVATSRFETVSAKVCRSSVATPSSPPMAWIWRIWSALVTCVVEKSTAAWRRRSKSASVPSTVLRMSRYAESISSALWIALAPNERIAGVTVVERVIPRSMSVCELRPLKLVISDWACLRRWTSAAASAIWTFASRYSCTSAPLSEDACSSRWRATSWARRDSASRISFPSSLYLSDVVSPWDSSALCCSASERISPWHLLTCSVTSAYSSAALCADSAVWSMPSARSPMPCASMAATFWRSRSSLSSAFAAASSMVSSASLTVSMLPGSTSSDFCRRDTRSSTLSAAFATSCSSFSRSAPIDFEKLARDMSANWRDTCLALASVFIISELRSSTRATALATSFSSNAPFHAALSSLTRSICWSVAAPACTSRSRRSP